MAAEENLSGRQFGSGKHRSGVVKEGNSAMWAKDTGRHAKPRKTGLGASNQSWDQHAKQRGWS